MNTLTLKIPGALDTALQLASARRNMTKSAVVREALEKVLADELRQTTPAVGWLVQWRGALSGQVSSQAVKAAGGAGTGAATIWMPVFADMGASRLMVPNRLRLLRDAPASPQHSKGHRPSRRSKDAGPARIHP